ncbi:unnamed protein product [Candidula unifasciata]|uniref:Uncharacterized protein n=1 Tax=Candidula unifasciata TaxID=100452 RepID=A0A8S3YLI3_9EUPU|nr:unnamed protein product [Candidula unifasciata]
MDEHCVMVDVHTHLTDDKLFQNISGVIDRALAKNVRAALVVTENIKEFEPAVELYKRFPKFVLPCLGLHPIQSTGISDESGIEVKRSVSLEDYAGVESAIERFADVIGAVGEIGLDFSPRFCKTAYDKEVQKLILTKQVQLAQKHSLPINVHSRSAGKQTIQLLKELDARHVLLHAFDGRASTALEGVANGYYFSVTASVCRDPQIQKMVKSLPLDRLMLETDSPAIAPVKGAINEPSNVSISCEYIARIKKVEMEEVKRITTENAFIASDIPLSLACLS